MSERSIRWQCRRGMRELDVLLLDYYEKHYPESSAQQKAAFHALLELPDPDLIGYFLGGQTPSDLETAGVITIIRSKTCP